MKHHILEISLFLIFSRFDPKIHMATGLLQAAKIMIFSQNGCNFRIQHPKNVRNSLGWFFCYFPPYTNDPNVPQKPMFFRVFAFFLKNGPSGGAVWRYNFHAGAWLRQAPAFSGARFRRRTLSLAHAFADARFCRCTLS